MSKITIRNKEYEVYEGSFAVSSYFISESLKIRKKISEATTDDVVALIELDQESDIIILNALLMLLQESYREEFPTLEALESKIKRSELLKIKDRIGELFYDAPEYDVSMKKAQEETLKKEPEVEETEIEKKPETDTTETTS